MGGRGSGINLIGDSRGRSGKPATWIKVIADLNRAASGRNVRMEDTLTDFADASREKYDGKVEVLGILHEDGYVLKALKGDNGYVRYTPDQRREMSGHDITHYHNRIVPSDAEKKEIETDTEKYKGVMRALSSYAKGVERYKAADKESRKLREDLKRSPGNRSILRQIDEAEKERTLAMRQIDRARSTFQERADAYDKPEPNRIPKRFSNLTDISMPTRKVEGKDETGYIGGCFSHEDLSSDLLAKDIPSFHACGDEGDYEIRPRKRASEKDLMDARTRIHELWMVPRRDAKKELAPDAYKFQRHLRGIDIKTNKEGASKGWSMQKRRAISFNRQMAYVWEVQKAICEKHNIVATFRPNPNYKPVYTEV